MLKQPLAFCLYGDFNWPPKPQGPYQRTANGCVIVRVIQPKNTAGYQFWLAWIPRDQLPDVVAGFPKADGGSVDKRLKFSDFVAHGDNDCLVWEKFRDPGKSVALLLDYDGGPNIESECLRFTGAFLLDQFSINGQTGDEIRPQRRFPLISRYGKEYGRREPGSGLSLGPMRIANSSTTSRMLMLELAIPTPFQQTPSLEEYRHEQVFPFSVGYRFLGNSWSDHDDPFSPIEFAGLELGAISESSRVKELPEDRRLGFFGFTPFSTSADFAGFDVSRNCNVHGLEFWSNFWPLNYDVDGKKVKQVALVHLQSFGLQLPATDEKSILTNYPCFSGQHAINETNLSICLYEQNDNSRETGNEETEGNPGRREAIGYRIRHYVSNRSGLLGGINHGIRSSRGQLRIGIEKEMGGWLDIGSGSFLFEAELSWKKGGTGVSGVLGQILDADSPESRNSLLQELLVPQLTASLSWEQKIAQDIGQDCEESEEGKPPVYRFGLLAQAFRSLRSGRRAIERVENRQPSSFLPEMQSRSQHGRWSMARFQIQNRFCFPVALRTVQESGKASLSWGTEAGERFDSLFWLSLAGEDRLDPSVGRTIPVEVRFPSFNPNDGQDGTGHALLLSRDETELQIDSPATTRFAAYRIKNDGQTDREFEGRLGGLHFSYQGTGLLNDDEDRRQSSKLEISRFSPSVLEGVCEPEAPVGLRARLWFNIDAIQPMGVDVPRGRPSTGRAPILIDMGGATQVIRGVSPYLLEVDEELVKGDDRSFRAILRERDAENQPANRSYLVLSQQPFGLLKFTRKPTQGNAGFSEIASFDGFSRQWRFFRSRDQFHYVFPPQAIGEAADKPRRNEIHDLDWQEGEPLWPPYPSPDDSKEISTYQVAHRMTPAAEIWVKPSDLSRNQVLPEWAADELFRGQGDFGPGVALKGFRGEFLYGLSLGINVDRETGAASATRVAEIEALIGRIQGSINYNTDQALTDRWGRVAHMLRQRPHRLEFWQLEPTNARPFQPANFSRGVSFALRRTALHRPPVAEPDGPSLADPVAPVSLRDDGPRYHEKGLSGGVLWPLESWNFFETLLKNPDSDGGSVANIALSLGGGDGDQVAMFRGGLVKVISSTRGGLVVRQVVEIKGRIGALWHQAKHVVVYEMTVNASAQFGSGKCDPNVTKRADSRTRRPVLRKVEEYVEILESVRSYPDFEKISAKTTGFLDSVRFNSTIIPVDSAWGEDIGKDGWRIPLWNRHSARVRPRVYPRPDISFVTVGEGKHERPLIAQECLDPDLLCFYSTLNAGSDTNAWEGVQSVDYGNCVDPGSMLEALNAGASPGRNGKGRMPNTGRFLPGFRRFTWRLAQAASKTRINNERGRKPIYAGLESVTFMRADLDSAREVSQELGKAYRKMGSQATAAAYWDATGRGAPAGLSLARHLAAFRSAVQAGDKAEANSRFDDLRSELNLGNVDTLTKQIIGDGSDLEGYYTDVQTRFTEFAGHIGDYESDLSSGLSQCQGLANNAIVGIKRKRRLVAEQVRALKARVQQQKLECETGKCTKAWIADHWTEQLTAEVRALLEGPAADFGNIATAIETARDAVRDLQQDIDSAVRRGRERVASVIAFYDRSKPWSERRVLEFMDKLEVELEGIWLDAESALNELRQRLATEIGGMGQTVSARIASAAAQAVKVHLDLLNGLDRQQLLVQDLGARAGQVLDRLGGNDTASDLYAELQGQLTKLKINIPAPPSSGTDKYKQLRELAAKIDPQPLKEKADRARLQLKAFVTVRQDDLKQVEQGIHSLRQRLSQCRIDAEALNGEVSGLVNAIGDLNEEAFKFLNTNLARLDNQIGEQISAPIAEFESFTRDFAKSLSQTVDGAIALVSSKLDKLTGEAHRISDEVLEQVDDVLAKVEGEVTALKKAFQPGGAGKDGVLLGLVRDKALRPAVEQALAPFGDQDFVHGAALHQEVSLALEGLADSIEQRIAGLTDGALSAEKKIDKACERLAKARQTIRNEIQQGVADVEKHIRNELKARLPDLKVLKKKLDDWDSNITEIKDLTSQLDRNLRSTANDVSETLEGARSYGDRVFNEVANVGKGRADVLPGNILRLHAAATSAPEIALLKSNVDRITATFRETEDLIRTSKAKALFDKLGDALKAIGIDLPYDKLGDQFLIDSSALKNMKLPDLLGSFGGIRLDSGFFEGVDLPTGIDRFVQISHDFDPKQSRAWIRIDVNVPLAGRNKLFQLGPVVCSYHETFFKGFVYLEASADAEGVQKQDDAAIYTAIDFEAAGQQLVRLEKVTIRYTEQGKLDFDFDPKYIRINKVFQFVQDTLGSLFPGKFGGMTVIKERGIPVGLEHDFTMPPMSLNFGTSGITNIGISNRFRLLAYPDFMISDRFNLSRREQPFIFSIFIIGGTGYIQVDTEYKPSDKSLSVMVEAAAGGSAALAFAVGPVAGAVYITLSVALSYRKLIGRPGGGMTVSLVLVIGGGVSLWGIVHVFLVLVLTLSYRSSGEIDASGDLQAEVRVCKWVKLKFRTTVTYKLRDGQATTQTSSSHSVEQGEKAKQLRKKAERLRGVRS